MGKHRPTHIKGNISIVMMFVLAIISLLALLGAYQIQHIIQLNTQTAHYYQSYYLAKGGIELATALVNNHGPGFVGSLSGTDVYKLPCQSSQTCERSVYIHGRVPHGSPTRYLTQGDQERICTEDTAIQLQPGETRSIPLFVDESAITGSQNMYNTSILSPDLDIEIVHPSSIPQNIAISIAVPDDANDLIQRHKRYMTGTTTSVSIKDFLHTLHVNTLLTGEVIQNNRLTYTVGNQTLLLRPLSSTLQSFENHLLITNPSTQESDDTLLFCIAIQNEKSELARSQTRIISKGMSSDTTVSLKALQNKQLPDFIFSTFIQR